MIVFHQKRPFSNFLAPLAPKILSLFDFAPPPLGVTPSNRSLVWMYTSLRKFPFADTSFLPSLTIFGAGADMTPNFWTLAVRNGLIRCSDIVWFHLTNYSKHFFQKKFLRPRLHRFFGGFWLPQNIRGGGGSTVLLLRRKRSEKTVPYFWVKSL